MNKFLTFAFIFALSFTANATLRDKSAAPDKATSETSLIASLYGRWEGEIEYQYFENSTFNKKYTLPFAIEVTPTSVEMYNKDEAGAWIKVRRSYINSFKLETDKDTIFGHFLNSGTDEDGLWVESQTLHITLKDDRSVLLYLMRAVNNTAVKDSVPGTKWMQMGAGELEKK
ncbi:MAG: hypothetical protein EOO07_24250 [Chitinophagaceae bacterium]|nr:MAG: hypothetical protein EOO07_24250 [Chitinophagaceae bacterium]